jgi:hypothetical protein
MADEQFGEQKRQFGIQVGLEERGFKERKREARKAERIGGLQLGVTGGFMGLQAHELMTERQGASTTGTGTRTSAARSGGGSGSGSTIDNVWGQRAAWAAGGIGGGMFGAGVAKAAGARKRWQTGAAGAAGGALATGMAGGGGWSMFIGGMLGGGMGALLG